MTQTDGGVLVGLSGVLAIWMATTDAILRYLRPGMRPWLTAAGCGLVLVGLATLFQAQRTAGGPRRSHVGWLLVLPLCVAAVVRPGPLGAYAAERQSALRSVDVGDFDLEQYLRAGSFAGQSPSLRIMDFLAASWSEEDRALLARQPVRLTGFVVPRGSDAFLLTRFTIGCCAGDAVAMQVRVEGLGDAVPGADTWVEVEGTYDAAASDHADGAGSIPVPILRAEHLERVDEPDNPYELTR